MSYNSLYYWKNFLEKDKETFVNSDSYILNFYIVNQNTSEIFYKWYSFVNTNELLGFIKFVVLPSGYYSRIFGESDGTVIITAESYDGALELLNNNIVRVDKPLINNFNEDYCLIQEVENDFNLESLKKFCNSFTSHLDYNDIVFSWIEVHKNIKEFGVQLVNSYEKDGMIDELERQMEMKKDEIIELFSSIDDNKFMLKKINDFLDSKCLL